MRLIGLRGQDGFSMVEVLITLMVISAAFISLSSLTDTTNSFAGKGSVNAYATDALNKFVTLYDNQNLASVNNILGTSAATAQTTVGTTIGSNSAPFNSLTGVGIDAVNALAKLPAPATAVINVCPVDITIAPGNAAALGSTVSSCSTYSSATASLKKVTITVKYGTPQRSRSTAILLAKAVDGGNH